MFMENPSAVANAVLGGWSLSSILTLQTGPFLTPIFSGGDPSGTNAPRRGTQRPDRVGAADGGISNPTRVQGRGRTAFGCPRRVAGSPPLFHYTVGCAPRPTPPPNAPLVTAST